MCFQEYSNDILFRLCLGLDNKSRDERVKYVATFLKEWNCQQSSEAGSLAHSITDVGYESLMGH